MKDIYFLIFVLFISFSCRPEKKNERPIEKESYLQNTILTNSDLYERSSKELRLMRNEIFARNGYVFKNLELRKHFEGTEWYTPLHSNVDSLLTDLEKQNIQLILSWEKSLQDNKNRQDELETTSGHEYEFYEIDYKSRIRLDDFYISLFSAYELPQKDLVKHSRDYYLIGHYIASTTSFFSNYMQLGQPFDTLRKQVTSIVEIDEPCSGILYGDNLKLTQQNIFRDGSNTLLFQNLQCSDNIEYIFFEIRDGIIQKKFSVESSGFLTGMEFTKLNDSLFCTYVTDRDDIVGTFQNDYKYIYNKNSDKLSFEKPDVQVINWVSEVLEKLNVYDNQHAARVDDIEHLIFELVPGDMIYLDSVYWIPGVIKIMKSHDSVGYVNVKYLNYETITTNEAG